MKLVKLKTPDEIREWIFGELHTEDKKFVGFETDGVVIKPNKYGGELEFFRKDPYTRTDKYLVSGRHAVFGKVEEFFDDWESANDRKSELSKADAEDLAIDEVEHLANEHGIFSGFVYKDKKKRNEFGNEAIPF